MSSRVDLYQNLLSKTTDEIQAHLLTLTKVYETGKEKEKIESLRQYYFLGSHYDTFCIIDEPSPFLLTDKMAQLVLTDLHQIASLKRDITTTPRLWALLIAFVSRFYDPLCFTQVQTTPPSIQALLKGIETEKKNKTTFIKSWHTNIQLDRILLWQEQKLDESEDLRSTLRHNPQSIYTLLPAILSNLKTNWKESTKTIAEAIMMKHLKETSTLSQYDPDKKRLFSKTPTKVIEIDGSLTKSFFTVLCFPTTGYYCVGQNANIFTFSFLPRWISSLYGSHEERSFSNSFADVICQYISRILAQSQLDPAVGNKIIGKSTTDPFLSPLLHSINILTLLCKYHKESIPHTFPLVEEVISRSKTKQQGSLFLACLSYFVQISDKHFDLTSHFNTFFYDVLPSSLSHAAFGTEVLHFCNEHKESLLERTLLLQAFFPSLLKIVCFSPMSSTSIIMDLLPALLSPENFVELFHSLLDFPLTTCALEKTIEFGSEEISPTERALCNHLLRDESGVTINFWGSSTTMPLLQEFCKSSVVTPRVRAICSLVPSLLELYFDVVIAYTDEKELLTFLPSIIERLDQLYPLPTFQVRIKKILVDKVLAMFHMYPEFLCSGSREIVLQTLTDSSTPGRSELILSLVWLIGEYVDPLKVESCCMDDVRDFHERLRFFAYERTSLVKNGITNIAFLSRTPLPSYAPVDPLFQETEPEKSDPSKAQEAESCREYTTRLMLMVMASVVKLATHCPDLYDHSSICFQKIWQHAEFFDKIVIDQAKDYLSLLQFPSLLSNLFRSNAEIPLSLMFLDENQECSPAATPHPLHLFE